ncbi:MAG TPA: hypothetical protein VGJ39_01210 [Vicinamibacterales bacterium]|jgi:hypothetical protein
MGAADTYPLIGAVPAAGRSIYVGPDDHLRITSFNSLAAVTLAVESRLMAPDGCVQDFADRHVPNTDRTPASTLIRLREGWLLDWLVRATAAAPRVGQCFVVVELVRGFTGAVVPIATLGQGYVTDTTRYGGPGSSLAASGEGPGVIRSITGTNPAAGVEITETVPTNARWRLIAMNFQFTTDATVSNRLVTIALDDGVTNFSRTDSGQLQGASTTPSYTGLVGAGFSTAAGGIRHIPLPAGPLLMGGFRIRTSTTNLQAGDDYTAPQLLVEEWIED